MARSSVEALPEEVRERIGQLRAAGHTIDEIMSALGELDDARISRSALGRHLHKMEKIGQQMRRSREVANALVTHLGDQPASRSAQLNIELLHSAVLQLFMAGSEGDGGEVDESGAAALKGNPEGIMMLAKAVDHLTRSSKSDAEFVKKVEEAAAEKARKSAAAVVDDQVKRKGLSPELAATIKAEIFGVRPNG